MLRGPGNEQYDGPVLQQGNGFAPGFQGQVSFAASSVIQQPGWQQARVPGITEDFGKLCQAADGADMLTHWVLFDTVFVSG